MATGVMVTKGGLSHLVAGNTVWNPRYRQHVFSNLRGNWGYSPGGSVHR